jgi:DNA-binding CsgD family transcriptional regulator
MVLDGLWNEAAGIAASIRQDTHAFTNAFFGAEVVLAVAEIALHRGDVESARHEVTAWFPLGPETPPGTRFYRPSIYLQQIAADLALADGDIELAAAWLACNDRWLAWAGCTSHRAAYHLGIARLRLVEDDPEAASACAETALRAASEPRQPLVLLRAHRMLGELATVRGELPAAEAHLATALDLAVTCEAPFEEALDLLAGLELDRYVGRLEAADPRLARTGAILHHLGAAPSLRRLAAVRGGGAPARPSLPFGLTARELEVLGLVAQGLTDAAIADRLFISPRTASQHLRSVFAKLDVSSRTAAARVAIDHGLA